MPLRRGEVRFNLPSPSVFELTAQRLTVGSWERGSNYLHSITGWTEKECSSLSSMTEWGGGGGGRSQMIGWSLSTGSRTLFVRGNRDKEFQFLGRRSPWKDVLIWSPKIPGTSPVKRTEFGDRSRRIKRSVFCPLRGKERSRILGKEDSRCLPARFYRTLLARKR